VSPPDRHPGPTLTELTPPTTPTSRCLYRNHFHSFVVPTVAASVDIVLHMVRDAQGQRVRCSLFVALCDGKRLRVVLDGGAVRVDRLALERVDSRPHALQILR
jgi:hypothetical protein